MEQTSITQEQINALIEKTLIKKIAYETALANYQNAENDEKIAENMAVIEYNKQYNTNFKNDLELYENNEKDFEKYLKILQKSFANLGISVAYNETYSYKFLVAKCKAEKELLLTSCEFLELYGKKEESELFKGLLNSYMKEEYKQKLHSLINKFLGLADNQ